MDNGNSLSRGDVVGSRLAAPDVTASSHSSKDPNRSPIYNPKKPISGVAMGKLALSPHTLIISLFKNKLSSFSYTFRMNHKNVPFF